MPLVACHSPLAGGAVSASLRFFRCLSLAARQSLFSTSRRNLSPTRHAGPSNFSRKRMKTLIVGTRYSTLKKAKENPSTSLSLRFLRRPGEGRAWRVEGRTVLLSATALRRSPRRLRTAILIGSSGRDDNATSKCARWRAEATPLRRIRQEGCFALLSMTAQNNNDGKHALVSFPKEKAYKSAACVSIGQM